MSGRKQATCCVLLLLFCFFSNGASSYNGQTCSGDKPVGQPSYCPTSFKPVFECQGAVNYPLRLVCSGCSVGITWQRWNDSTSTSYWQNIPCTAQTLEYTAEEVGKSLTGCYQCWCYHSSSDVTSGSVIFSVDVQPASPPKLLMPNTPEEHGEFILDPVTVNLVVNQQMVCFPFNSTGWPDVAYDMYYRPNPEEDDYLPVTANQSCLVQSGVNGDKLCYIPPVSKHLRIGDFMSVAHNIAGNITALQSVTYNADPIWSIKPHPAQTTGNVTLDHESGVGKAVCAAYEEDLDVTLQYFVCPIPNGMTAEEAACLYYRGNLSCYMCGDGGAGFNSTRSDSVSDLGIETRSCLVDVWEEGQFVCLAQRQWMNGSKSIYQPTGNFTARTLEPQPISHPFVCDLDSLQIGLITLTSVLGVVVACCCVGCCVGCYFMWRCKPAKENYSGPLNDDSKEGGFHEALSEKAPLLQWNWSARKPKPAQTQTTSTAIRILCRAPGDPDFTNILAESQCLSHPFQQEPGMEYQIQFLSDGIVLEEVLLATPEDSRKELESFPPELEKAVPLDTQSVLKYTDRLAPHYEAVGHVLGADNTVRCLRPGNADLPVKMTRILDVWILTGKATWGTLVLGLEKYIPHLRGLASEIRKDLREELEKSASGTDGMCRSQSPPPVSEQASRGIPVTAEITPQPGVHG